MRALRDRFAALVGAPGGCDLGRAALEIARIAYPDLDPAPHLAHLDRLADAVRPRLAAAGPGAVPRALAVAAYLFGELGFRGNRADYDDPRNSFLNDVLARRTGIPISLAVVLMEVARRAGVVIEGVGFPGHFLVRVRGDDGFVLLEPFDGGRAVPMDELVERAQAFVRGRAAPLTQVPPAFLEAAPAAAILARMLRNLLHVWLERDAAEPALAAVDLVLALTPDSPDDLRTRAHLWERVGCVAAACDDLRRVLELVPDAPEAPAVRAALARLGRRRPTLH